MSGGLCSRQPRACHTREYPRIVQLLRYDLGFLSGDDVVEVTLTEVANVRLLGRPTQHRRQN